MDKSIISPKELRALLNRRRYVGERIHDKRAIRFTADEIERLSSVLQMIEERARDALAK